MMVRETFTGIGEARMMRDATLGRLISVVGFVGASYEHGEITLFAPSETGPEGLQPFGASEFEPGTLSEQVFEDVDVYRLRNLRGFRNWHYGRVPKVFKVGPDLSPRGL